MPWKSRVKRHSERIGKRIVSPTVVKEENRDFKFQFLRIIIAFCNSERFSSLCHRKMCMHISLQIFFREFLGVFLYAFLRIC